MNKKGLFLKTGFMLLLSALVYSAAIAQTGTPNSGNKTTGSFISQKENQAARAKVDQSNSNAIKDGRVEAETQKADFPSASAEAIPVVSRGRNCTPKYINKPYSISRTKFNQLPKDRQQFILSNLNKYTIVD